MALELYRLIEKVSHMDITLLAGDSGLHNIVRWVHMVETKEASDFLEGGEIAFSTGIGIGHNNNLSLMELVESIWKSNAAGMVINIGPFIETIPDEVIRFGNEHNFPIYSVPWRIHIAEIVRIFCFAITKSDQKSMETASAFKNAIFFPQQEELYVISLSKHGFFANWPYYVCAMKLQAPATQSISVSRLESICTTLNNYLCHKQYKNFAIFHYENQLLAVLGNYSVTESESFFIHMEHCMKSSLKPGEEYFLGIGKCTMSIRCLHKSFHQAVAIQKLQENHKISKTLNTYANLGIYKLLMGIEDKEILAEYCDKIIQPLKTYDEKNNSDLATVLRCYLLHNGSVKETSDELFVHRNTINYKVNKASEILNLNISLLETRLQLTLGFMIQDML